MPARPFVPSVVSVVLTGDAGGGFPWVNKYHVRYTGAAPTITDLQAYAASLTTSWGTHFAPLVDSGITLTACEVVDLASAFGAGGNSIVATSGSRAGVPIGGQACVLCSWHIGRRYRGGHPRTYYLPGVGADLNNAATWQGAYTTAVGVAVTALQAAFIVPTGLFSPVEQVNVSYFGGVPTVDEASQPRLVPLVDVIAPGAFTISPKLATQRRRVGRK
jgi:hypothetical protein